MATSESPKTALVLSGGGTRCAYSGGALVGLARALQFTKPDIIVAASGSVGGSLYFIAEQYDDIEEIWTNMLADNDDFISFTRRQIMDIDYLVDEILKNKLPLNQEKFESTDVEYYFPVRSLETRHICVLTREDKLDIYDVIRAAAAAPIVYNETIKLYDDHFIDGFLSLPIERLIQQAIDRGAERVIVIDNTLDWRGLKRSVIHSLVRMMFGEEFIEAVEKDLEFCKEFRAPENVEIVYVKPSQELPLGLLSNDRPKLNKAFHLGYHDISNDENVLNMFGKKFAWRF